jgi:hypothetical protein
LHGGGQIPASDYVVSKSGATLKTDTTTNPNFTGEICNWGGYCTGFSGGVISLAWTLNNYYIQTTTGTQVEKLPGVTTRLSGTWTQTSARVTGSILGIQFAPGDLSGAVTKAHGASLTTTPNASRV